MTHVKLDHRQIKKVAAVVATLDSGTPLNFYSFIDKAGKETLAYDMYPHRFVPKEDIVNFFFFAGWNEYGFWLRDEKGYVSPLYGTFRGKEKVKGSDLMWRLAKRAFDRDPRIFTPEQLFSMEPSDWVTMMSDDNGPVPQMATNERFAMSKRHAAYFLSEKCTPLQLVEKAQAAKNPVRTFLALIARVPGFAEDPLQKKSILLAMALANRPEKFLTASPAWKWPPIIDTHLQRVALRLGLVTLPKDWRKENTGRSFTTAMREEEIRRACGNALGEVIKISGRSMAEVDVLFWMARKYCPEMEIPLCVQCKFADVCARRIELFQPILETTAY